MFNISFCHFFFLFQELPLLFLWGIWVTDSSNLFFWGCLYFSFIPEGSVHLIIEFKNWHFFFFRDVKNLPLPSSPHCFWREILCPSQKKKKKNGDGGRVQQRSIKTSMGLMERKMGVIMERGKDGEACCAAVHGVPKSQTQLSHWIMMETKKGVEGPIQRQNTLPPLWGACCHQNSSNVGSYQGKAYWKEPLSWLAAHVICLGGQVKNLFLPRKDKLTFFLYNLTEYTFLTSDDLEKHIAIFQQRVRVTRTRNLGPGSLCIHTVER